MRSSRQVDERIAISDSVRKGLLIQSIPDDCNRRVRHFPLACFLGKYADFVPNAREILC